MRQFVIVIAIVIPFTIMAFAVQYVSAAIYKRRCAREIKSQPPPKPNEICARCKSPIGRDNDSGFGLTQELPVCLSCYPEYTITRLVRRKLNYE